MINFIRIENFKSLRNVALNLKNLNLFMGLNSMGKSSVIQSLLMLRQSYIRDNSIKNLYINNELVSLGNSKDVFYQDADPDDSIKYTLENNTSSFSVKYKYKEDVDVLSGDILSAKNEKNLALFKKSFHYLAADHISPAKTYNAANAANNIYNQLGNNGENAPYYLAKLSGKKLLNTKLHHNKAKSNLIAHELDAWMSEISPGATILSEEISELGIVKMWIEFEKKYETTLKSGEKKITSEFTNPYSPVNVGFGIPYVLPLILTLLISQPGDLVLIENPESHLHPRGQAELGKLIALASQSGVQIICETHSDHIINGIRVAVKENNIDSNKVRLFYFDKNETTKLETEVTPINVDKNGELDSYPTGLLDEWGNLMAKLF